MSKFTIGDRMRTHGMSGTRLHRIWKAMRTRCYNPNATRYKYWGGKGIKIDKEWDDFMNFYNWSINNGYRNDLTIDRINNNKNYSSKNCRWVTGADQNRNHDNHIIYKGEMAADASKRLGGKGENLVAQRIRILGWTKKKAFTTPVIK